MICGALVDAGAPLEALQDAVDAVVPGAVQWEVRTVVRGGLRATSVHPRTIETDRSERSWSDIRAQLEASDLDAQVREQATAVFERLATAEARVHGMPVADVHFHEVGGLDAIADVVGTCAALSHLGIREVTATPLAVGSGRVHNAHGNLPVPVPAVLELCSGWRAVAGGDGELATPTGAALITSLAVRCTWLPDMTVRASGNGAGSRDTPDRPNVVRVVIGSTSGAASAGRTTEVVLEANIDDLDPRLWPTILESLLGAGASDAWIQPIVMKKGRPAHTLAILAPPDRVTALRQVVFESTTTIGLREYVVRKHALDRAIVQVEVAGDVADVKVAIDDGRVVHATPEFDDVLRIARARSRPARDVLEEAVASAARAGLTPGVPFTLEP